MFSQDYSDHVVADLQIRSVRNFYYVCETSRVIFYADTNYLKLSYSRKIIRYIIIKKKTNIIF